MHEMNGFDGILLHIFLISFSESFMKKLVSEHVNLMWLNFVYQIKFVEHKMINRTAVVDIISDHKCNAIYDILSHEVDIKQLLMRPRWVVYL